MGRQLRTLPARGGADTETVFIHNSSAGGGGPLGSSGKIVTVPNYGVSIFYGATAATYVLDRPAAGVRKTLIAGATVSTATAIQASTDGAVSVTFNSSAAGSKTKIVMQASVDRTVSLIGVNSTEWRVMYASPSYLTVSSTGIQLTTS